MRHVSSIHQIQDAYGIKQYLNIRPGQFLLLLSLFEHVVCILGSSNPAFICCCGMPHVKHISRLQTRVSSGKSRITPLSDSRFALENVVNKFQHKYSRGGFLLPENLIGVIVLVRMSDCSLESGQSARFQYCGRKITVEYGVIYIVRGRICDLTNSISDGSRASSSFLVASNKLLRAMPVSRGMSISAC